MKTPMFVPVCYTNELYFFTMLVMHDDLKVLFFFINSPSKKSLLVVVYVVNKMTNTHIPLYISLRMSFLNGHNTFTLCSLWTEIHSEVVLKYSYRERTFLLQMDVKLLFRGHIWRNLISSRPDH